jgi:hypothetical protein
VSLMRNSEITPSWPRGYAPAGTRMLSFSRCCRSAGQQPIETLAKDFLFSANRLVGFDRPRGGLDRQVSYPLGAVSNPIWHI